MSGVRLHDKLLEHASNPETAKDKGWLEDSQVMSANAAVTIKHGTIVITKATALGGSTVPTPVSGDDDGKKLKIISTTAAAHVLTFASGKINGGALTTATFAAAIGNGFEIIAYGGVWYTLSAKGVTIS